MQMIDLSVLFQGYGPKAKDERYFCCGDEVTFELRHGDTMPGDVGRPDGEFNRIELSIKPSATKPLWRYDPVKLEYQVAAPWKERRVGEGHIILGQVHCAGPQFSLRWQPNKKKPDERLILDFITTNKGASIVPTNAGNLLQGLNNGDFLSVTIETKNVRISGFDLTCSVEVGDVKKEKSVICDFAALGVGSEEAVRFKVGAYRKNKDQKHWPSMTFTYRNIKVDGYALDEKLLINPTYNAGY